MTPDAGLDNLAFFVGLRLMGVDARRRLRLTLLRHPDVASPPLGMAERLERLDALLDGRREPETMQDRLDVARAERERATAPFDPTFWLARTAELIAAGLANNKPPGWSRRSEPAWNPAAAGIIMHYAKLRAARALAGGGRMQFSRDMLDFDGNPRRLTRRACLRCRKSFESTGPGNRLCRDCQMKAADASPYAV